MPDRLIKLLESLGRPRILVVGDLILDKYVWGNAERISPEGPIPVLRVTSEESRPGGAGNVTAALATLDAVVTPCGVVGADEHGKLITARLARLSNDTGGIIASEERSTTVKTRYIGYVQSARRGIQHMLRVDNESTAPIAEHIEDALLAHIESALPEQNAVVLSDYDKGVLTERVLRSTITMASERGIPVIGDPKMGRSYSVYKGVTTLTPNRYEAELATGIAPRDAESARKAAEKILRTADLRHVVITLDRDGIYLAGYLAGEGDTGVLLPTRIREVFDVTGAGDMVVSVLALLLAVGAPMRDAAALANVAAGIEVAKIGAAPVSRAEILAELRGGDGIQQTTDSRKNSRLSTRPSRSPMKSAGETAKSSGPTAVSTCSMSDTTSTCGSPASRATSSSSASTATTRPGD